MRSIVADGLIIMMAIMLLGSVRIIGASPSSITVVDDLGRTVVIASSERIVSIGPSNTEILYALGLGDRIVAVDKYSDYPPEAIAKQKISKVLMPDPEEIVNLNPDLVVYFHWGPWDPTVETLSSLGLTVIALAPKTLEDVLSNIRLLGRATGKIQEAEALASALNQRINEVRSKIGNVTVKPKVYIETYYPPPWPFGPNSWGHQLIELAGGVNAFGDAQTEWVQTTDEEVIVRNPDVIVSLYGVMHYATLEDFKKRPGWDRIKAVADGAVYLLDENLFIRPGPRIVDGLESLAKILHPEFFGEARVSTFAINATLLKTGIQSFKVSGPVDVEISVIKAFEDCTLMVTLSQDGPNIPSNKKLVGSYVSVDCSSPEGLAFVLRIYYTDGDLKMLGISEDSLRIFMWSDKAGWIALNSAINRSERYVEAVVMHLSSFALMGESIPPLPFWEQNIPLWLFVASLIIVVIVSTMAYMTRRRARVSANAQ